MAIQEYTPPVETERQALRIRDIAWFAGLTEGEASFQWHSTPIIDIQMTDHDVIERVSHLVEYGITTYKPRGKETYKQVWGVRMAGARAAGWMMTLYSFMGERRQAKIRELLLRWKTAPGFPRGRKGEALPAVCHPDRPRQAQGLCQECYNRQYHQAHPEVPSTVPARCHPDRVAWRDGLCSGCYQQDLRKRRKAQPPKQFATCHPELRMYAKGLCQNCYQRQGYAHRHHTS